MSTREKDGSIKVRIEMIIKPKQEKKTNKTLSTQLSSTSTETDLSSKPSTSVDPEPLQERQESHEADTKDEDSQREESEPEIKLSGEAHTPGCSSKNSQVKVHTPGCSSKDSHVKVQEESDIDIEQQSSHSEHSSIETPVDPEPLQERQESQEADTNDEDSQREESEPEIKHPGEAHTPGCFSKDSQVKVQMPGCSSKDSQVKVQEESDIDIEQQSSHSEHSSMETPVGSEPLQEWQAESQEAYTKDEDSQREESEPENKLPGEAHTPGCSSKDSQVKVHTPGCSSKDSHVKVQEESDIDIEQQSSHSEHSSMETPVDPEPLQERQESQEADTNDEDNQREESEPEIKLPGEAHTPGCFSKDSQVKVQEEFDIDIKQQPSHSEHSLESTFVHVSEQSLQAESGDSTQADSCEQDKDASKKGIFSRLKSGAANIIKVVTNNISWNTKEPRMKPIVIKREKPIVIKREKCVKLTKQSEEGQVPTEYIAVLMSAIPFKDIKDCSLSVKLSGKNCKNKDVGLFVRYS